MESEYHSLLINNSSGTLTNHPDLNLFILLLLPALFLLLSAMIAAAESAFFLLDADDLRDLRAKKGNTGKLSVKLHDNPEKLKGTITAAGNTVNLIYLCLAAYLGVMLTIAAGTGWGWFIVIMLSAALLLLITGLALPKAFGTARRVKVVLMTARLMSILQVIFHPLVSVLSISASSARKKKEPSAELSADLEIGSDNADEDEKILKGIVNFGNINVSAIMCPRSDVTAVDIKTPFDKIIPVIIESGFSRIPVYSGSFDSVKGILYSKDVLPYTRNPSGFKWQSLLRPSYFVPETKKISDLLKEFQVRKIHMAIVIDEYGGTSGIVTLEDILEEIVGEITDESDEEETLFRKTGDNSYIFEAKILLDDFCRVMNTDEEQFREVRGESETLAGLMLELAGEIPQKDHVISFGNFVFKIESADRRRVRQVRVDIKKENEGTD